MQIEPSETEVIGMARHAARLGLALEHDDARDAEPPERQRRRESRRSAADDCDVGVLARDARDVPCARRHDRSRAASRAPGTPSTSASVRSVASATNAATVAPQ